MVRLSTPPPPAYGVDNPGKTLPEQMKMFFFYLDKFCGNVYIMFSYKKNTLLFERRVLLILFCVCKICFCSKKERFILKLKPGGFFIPWN